MLKSTHRFIVSAAIVLSIAAPLALSPASQAQTEVRPGEENARIAVVRSNDVYIRCGAAESYYPFARLNAGDLVKVTGEKFEWSRVMTAGPAFAQSFGYIKYAKSEAGRFRLAADGKSGVTLGKIDIIAPNLDTKNNPKDSWKSLVRLEADQTLRVIEAIHGDKDVIVKVALPEYAQGWVSTAYLEPATPDQVKQWHEQLAAKPQTPKHPAATTPPSTILSQPVTTVITSNSPAADQSAAPVQTNKPIEVVANTPAPQLTWPDHLADPAASNESSTDAGAFHDAADLTTIDPAAQPEAPAAKPAKEKKPATWEDLENALKLLQKEPAETAEVGPLRELYLDLAKRSINDARIARYANGRAEQLKLWAETQQKRSELEALRNRTKLSAEEAIAVEKALLSSAEYVAVGRVAASTIYDGQSLPKLLRLQEAATGRTVAYLQPDEDYEIVKLVGSLVGIVGEKNYDGTIRLNIITPKRVDVLTPELQTATAPTDTVSPQ